MFRYFLALSLILSATGFIFPPKFRRYDYEEEFKYVLQIAKENPGSTIPLISSNRQIDIVAGNLLSLPWKPESLKSNNAFLILDKEEKLSPIRKEKIAKENQEMRADENFKKFRVKFENENFTVFEKIHD